MSVVDLQIPMTGIPAASMGRRPRTKRPLHRLRAVRRQQGISHRLLAHKLDTDVSTIRRQEQKTSDLMLSTLYEWQKILEVPVSELLVEPSEGLSPPVMQRARMLRLMKTAAALLERAKDDPTKRLARMLVDQIIEIMPELEGVTPWNAVGKPRTTDEVGQAARRRISLEFLMNLVD